ncbi:MAG: hypothetical protein KVP17_000955 [Porospora cf. gigantea B]|uniref:uncharacterized protein n=1 Tax=Porospora cf. gigantea B TaxID=2853592 RepID=UPI00357189CF|nr:MAG: hypothetical protein KVP17_000955 [Porospora cf. gigantea B]
MELGDEKREGARGGLEQFKWDSIKDASMNERESYLGQSLRIGMLGRFGRYHKNDWWWKGRGDQAAGSERGQLKDFEAELLEEAIGSKPRRLLLTSDERAEKEEAGEMPEEPTPLGVEVEGLMAEYMQLKEEYQHLLTERDARRKRRRR